MSLYIRDTHTVHGQIDVENADNSGGHVIGELYRYTNTESTFVIISKRDFTYGVLIEGIIKEIKQSDFAVALQLGKIELVKWTNTQYNTQ